MQSQKLENSIRVEKTREIVEVISFALYFHEIFPFIQQKDTFYRKKKTKNLVKLMQSQKVVNSLRV